MFRVCASTFTSPKNWKPLSGEQVRLSGRRRLDERQLWTERAVERIGAEGPGVERAGDEFPEPVEIAEGFRRADCMDAV